MDINKIVEMNNWWKDHSVKKGLLYSYKRKLFHDLGKYVELRQIIAIVGLRRTGKTSLIYQLIQKFIDDGINPVNILYFSFDESTEDLTTLINLYKENVLKKDLSQEKIFVFLDEIQKLKNWQNQIKTYYDLYPNVKFLVSGSASLNILLDAKENLAGRIFYFDLEILSFMEFLELKGLDVPKIIGNANLWKSEIKTQISNYLTRAFPEIINSDDEIAKKYVKESIIEKTIFRDLSVLFEIKDLELIQKLIQIVASNPGMIINLDDISRDLGRSRQLISNYLYYMESCFTIKGLRNFRGSLKSSSRKLKKYYLAHPCLALSISDPDEGRTMENLAQFVLKAENYWREKNKEVDFIILKDNVPIPYEIKYKSDVGKKEISGLLSFMDEFKINEGHVITSDYEAKENVNGKIVKFIPMWKWLLNKIRDTH